MADKKISALTAATTPLAGTEVLPIVQSGSTVKVSVTNLTLGRAVSASSLTSTGSISAGIAGYTFNGTSVLASDGSSYYLSTGTALYIQGNGVINTGGSNIAIATSGKGITTASAIPLGFGTNNSVTPMTLDTSGNLLVGAATTAGAATNVKFVTGGIFSTANGSAASTSAVAATLFAVNGTDNEVYIVSAAVPTGTPALYVTVYLVTCGGGTLSATVLQSATSISISVSGLNVRATQISGAPQNIAWKALRVA